MNTLTTLNPFRKSLLIGLTAFGMATAGIAAHAQNAAPEGRHGHMAQQEAGGAKFGERMAKHQAMLHDKLKLSAAQEPAWAAFTAATAPKMPDTRPERAAMEKMTAPERLEEWITLSKQRIAAQESHLAALKTFYAVLTPEQQKIVNDSMPRGGRGHHRGHHGMMP